MTDEKSNGGNATPQTPPATSKDLPKYILSLPSGDEFYIKLGIRKSELEYLIKFRPDYEARAQFFVFLIGVFLTPITLVGALLGFIRGFERFGAPINGLPYMHRMHPILKVAMFLGAAAAWVVVILLFTLFFPFASLAQHISPWVASYLIANTTISFIAFGAFRLWRWQKFNRHDEEEKFGTARFAQSYELEPYRTRKGIYIGSDCSYEKQGHLLTVAGSRSGKFTNLIAPNLLGYGNIDGSWFVIDPKGEIAAVTQRAQKGMGQHVVILNPWGVVDGFVDKSQCYNPLDVLDVTSPHLVDDCFMLAEMLVPVEKGLNKFFSDSARSLISGLLLYIAVAKTGEDRTLKTLWKIIRYPQEEWDRVLAEMENWNVGEEEIAGETFVMGEKYENPHSENLLYAASEIEKLTKSGNNTWGSILSTALQATEFLKSPALQQSLQSGFDPQLLAHNKVTLYVIIPADKLQSHSRWLRLVVTSCMRAVIRKPNKKVVFVLDEFAALGYLPEIETAIGSYAGFNVTVWPILQSLVQLQNLYEKNWEIFIGSSAVRHFFGINNNFDAEYISKAIGKKSHMNTQKGKNNDSEDYASQRDLINPDELRIESGKAIFTFVDDLPPVMFGKQPYYEVEELDKRADKNPYISQS
jgi:type IV secretion system protein VirD4